MVVVGTVQTASKYGAETGTLPGVLRVVDVFHGAQWIQRSRNLAWKPTKCQGIQSCLSEICSVR